MDPQEWQENNFWERAQMTLRILRGVKNVAEIVFSCPVSEKNPLFLTFHAEIQDDHQK